MFKLNTIHLYKNNFGAVRKEWPRRAWGYPIKVWLALQLKFADKVFRFRESFILKVKWSRLCIETFYSRLLRIKFNTLFG